MKLPSYRHFHPSIQTIHCYFRKKKTQQNWSTIEFWSTSGGIICIPNGKKIERRSCLKSKHLIKFTLISYSCRNGFSKCFVCGQIFEMYYNAPNTAEWHLRSEGIIIINGRFSICACRQPSTIIQLNDAFDNANIFLWHAVHCR